MALVISAFPGTGKSTIWNNSEEFGFNKGHVYYDEREGVQVDLPASLLPPVFDSDSSVYPKEHFPGNYIKHIQNLMEQYPEAVIMASSHEDVRKGLYDAGVRFVLVYPEDGAKEDFILRYKNRGSSDEFINKFIEEWDELIESCKNDKLNKIYHYRLQPGEFLKDIFHLLR